MARSERPIELASRAKSARPRIGRMIGTVRQICSRQAMMRILDAGIMTIMMIMMIMTSVGVVIG
jgi:hypothetical protein